MRYVWVLFYINILFVSHLQAQKSGVYRFDKNLEDESGKLPKLKILGKTGIFKEETLPELQNTKRNVYVFEKNTGLQFDNKQANGFLGGSYTIEIYFRFTALDSWKRVIDFKNRKSDYGCYVYDGKLNFYDFIMGANARVRPDEYTHYVVSRNVKTQQFKMYVDGEPKIAFIDNYNQGVVDDEGLLNFFFDDLIVKDEASAGAVAMIKLYDYVVEPLAIKRSFQMLQDSISKPPAIMPIVLSSPPPSPVEAKKPVENPKNYTNFDKKTVVVGTSIVLKNLLFEQGKATLLPESDAELSHLLVFMRQNPTVEIELQGHTDNQGDFDLNLKLSRQRVEEVKTYLVSNGISAQRVSGKGFGASRPVASNNRQETRQLNRRVELLILKF